MHTSLTTLLQVIKAQYIDRDLCFINRVRGYSVEAAADIEARSQHLYTQCAGWAAWDSAVSARPRSGIAKGGLKSHVQQTRPPAMYFVQPCPSSTRHVSHLAGHQFAAPDRHIRCSDLHTTCSILFLLKQRAVWPAPCCPTGRGVAVPHRQRRVAVEGT